MCRMFETQRKQRLAVAAGLHSRRREAIGNNVFRGDDKGRATASLNVRPVPCHAQQPRISSACDRHARSSVELVFAAAD
jgi:hypothetical protein